MQFFLPPPASLVYREGTTPDQTRSVFDDLFRRLGLDENVLAVDMLFCGPNIAAGLHNVRHIFRHISSWETERSLGTDHDGGVLGFPVADRQPNPSVNASCPGSSGVSVTLHFNTGLYHDVSGLFSAPDALFLFNAGIWGYDDWVPTLELIFGCDATSSVSIEGNSDDRGSASPPSHRSERSTVNSGAPPPSGVVVVTSYCAEEAEDDMETVERVLLQNARRSTCSGPSATSRPEDASQVEWLWKPEVNPHRSLVPRHAACAVEGRILFENQMWQAIRPSRPSQNFW